MRRFPFTTPSVSLLQDPHLPSLALEQNDCYIMSITSVFTISDRQCVLRVKVLLSYVSVTRQAFRMRM